MSCLAREWLRVNEMQYSSRKDGILDEISQVSKIFQRFRSKRLLLYQVLVNVVVISLQKHNMWLHIRSALQGASNEYPCFCGEIRTVLRASTQ